mmetsp:Transcript_30066/g.26647  ORF Transcript_30066/g.26647 Transcript_30066/m.26647 type:complete len:128 (+) Transcript_30066:882-1265(+)
MLIVFLQDVCKPPVLPRIICQDSNILVDCPAYIERDGEKTAVINQVNPKIDQQKIKDFTENSEINSESLIDLFRKFISFYFGGGFNIVHDVVDTRAGRIKKIMEIPTKDEEGVNGIDNRVRNSLENA